MLKFGTVKELEAHKGAMPGKIYTAALSIVGTLDREYSAGRDVEHGDGGFVLLVESAGDLVDVERYIPKGAVPESVSIIETDAGAYVNTLFLFTNDFGVNVFKPLDYAPRAIYERYESRR